MSFRFLAAVRLPPPYGTPGRPRTSQPPWGTELGAAPEADAHLCLGPVGAPAQALGAVFSGEEPIHGARFAAERSPD